MDSKYPSTTAEITHDPLCHCRVALIVITPPDNGGGAEAPPPPALAVVLLVYLFRRDCGERVHKVEAELLYGEQAALYA